MTALELALSCTGSAEYPYRVVAFAGDTPMLVSPHWHTRARAEAENWAVTLAESAYGFQLTRVDLEEFKGEAWVQVGTWNAETALS